METDIKKANFAIKYLQLMRHPVVQKIISLLEEEKDLSATKISIKLGLNLALTSHYLTGLINKGVLIKNSEGVRWHYNINPFCHKQLLETINDACKFKPHVLQK